MLKLSASSIGTYDKCNKKYYYTYINKPDIVKPDWSHLEAGKFCHRVLELLHLHLMSNVVPQTEYSKLMSKFFAEASKEFNKDILRPDLPEIKKMLSDYLKVLKRDGLPEVIGVEIAFKFEIEDFVVKGFIDRIDRIGPGEYRIVDYKTSKNPKYLDSFQLLLYAIAVKELYADAQKIWGSYVLLKHESTTKDWEFTQKDIDKAIKTILDTGGKIKADQLWKKKPTRLCDWCDFKSICLDKWTENDFWSEDATQTPGD